MLVKVFLVLVTMLCVSVCLLFSDLVERIFLLTRSMIRTFSHRKHTQSLTNIFTISTRRKILLRKVPINNNKKYIATGFELTLNSSVGSGIRHPLLSSLSPHC
uniref:Uncharacterized protein n=1 Tax=Cacopsylla melanoneura TaxID=428564 RepID=A0A8D8SIQ2_9HEMI